MLKNKHIIILLCSIISLGGCVTYKADSFNTTAPDYNNRVEVSDAHFDKVITPIGVTSIVATTLGSGYWAYSNNLIQYSDGNKIVTSKVGNAILGAAIGFGTSYTLNKLLGWGKTKPSTDPTEWIKKANKNYLLISSNNTSLKLIPKNADANFQIKVGNDANEFISVFKNSNYKDDVFKTGVNNLARYELPSLINLFPNTTSLLLAKDKYIVRSQNYSDIVSAVKMYPESKNNYETNFLNLIATCDDAVDFKNRYSNSSFLKKGYLYAFKTDNQSKSKILSLNNLFNNGESIGLNDLKAEDVKIQRNFVNSKYILDNHNNPEYLVEIYKNYSQLKYNNKNIDFLRYYLNKLDNNLADGNEVIWRLRALENKNYYPSLSISTYDIETVISTKLKEEVEKNVQIISSNSNGSKNEQWEDWKRNSNYTAGIVGDDDAVYILYGDIKNNSKYNLPVEINGSGKLVSTVRIQGNGSISNAIIGFLNSMSGGALNNISTIDHGTQTSSFCIPSLPRKSVGAYAIRLDFKGAWIRKGVNLFDAVKGTVEPNLTNQAVSIRYLNYAPNEQMLQNQKENLLFANNGIPSTKLTDMWNGGEVNDAEWKEKWRIRQEEIRRAAKERRDREEKLLASGTCWKYEKATKIKYKDVEYDVAIYTNLKNSTSISLFYFPGDDHYKSGYYHFDWGLFSDDLNYGGPTEQSALIELTNCK
jgi:hypothetical protein